MKKITTIILLLLISYTGDTKTTTCMSSLHAREVNSVQPAPVSGDGEMLENNNWVLATRFKI